MSVINTIKSKVKSLTSKGEKVTNIIDANSIIAELQSQLDNQPTIEPVKAPTLKAPAVKSLTAKVESIKTPAKPINPDDDGNKIVAYSKHGTPITQWEQSLWQEQEQQRKKVQAEFEAKAKLESGKANAPANVLPTYYIVREGYYLAYSDRVQEAFDPAKPKFETQTSGGVYVISDRDGSQTNISRLIHKGSKKTSYAMGLVGRVEVKNLTRDEFNKLVQAKLPWQALQKAYEWDNQFIGPIWFNFNEPTLVM